MRTLEEYLTDAAIAEALAALAVEWRETAADLAPSGDDLEALARLIGE